MKTKAQIWLRNLAAAAIVGGSTTALAALGIVAADSIGVDVRPLDFAQVGILFVSGAVVGLLAYLKQSPLPPIEE